MISLLSSVVIFDNSVVSFDRSVVVFASQFGYNESERGCSTLH